MKIYIVQSQVEKRKYFYFISDENLLFPRLKSFQSDVHHMYNTVLT